MSEFEKKNNFTDRKNIPRNRKSIIIIFSNYFCAIIRLTQMKRNIETKRRKLKVSRCRTGDY